MKFAIIPCTFLMLLPSMQLSPAAAVPAGMKVLHNVVYGQVGSRKLHVEVYVPAPSSSPMPAVLLIHGGGWRAGMNSIPKIDSLAYKLGQKGILSASVEYRLTGEAPWPAQIQDCQLAVRWLRANAAKYNVDPDKFGCWGTSAGGHLTDCLGTMADDPALPKTGGYPDVSDKVQAVVSVSGPSDLRSGTYTDGSTTIDAQQKAKALTTIGYLFGGVSLAKNPELYKQASPITHVHAGEPPFLLIGGEKDQIVSITQVTTFADALSKAGVPVELKVVKNAGHGAHGIKGGPPPELDDGQVEDLIVNFLVKTLKG
jgi:acetyl esterase/lipase